jgi:hypothetical protein
MKSMVKNIFFIFVGVFLFLAIAEIVMRFLPVMSPTHLTAGIGHAEAAKHAPGSEFVQSRDWDFLLARQGQINDFGLHGHCQLSTQAKTGIWIAGDSYTEAIMLEPNQSIGAKLQQFLPGFLVCAAGMSGASAAEYLSQLDDLHKIGQAATWVVVINQPDFLESYEGRDGLARFPINTQKETRELIGDAYKRPALLERFFVSALFRYSYYNLNFKGVLSRLSCTLHLGACTAQTKTTAQTHQQQQLEEAAIQRFIGGLQRRAAQHSSQIWIVCNDTLKHKGRQTEDIDFWAMLIQRFHQAGFSTLRTSTVLKTQNCAKQSCFLFRDGHWSESGHEAVAHKLSELIRGQK